MSTLVVLNMMNRAGAISSEKAVAAKELMAHAVADEKKVDLDTVSSRLSDLFKRRPDMVGRVDTPYVEGSGTRYKYFIKRAPKLTATGRMTNKKRKSNGALKPEQAGYKIQIEGPGLLLEREVNGERAIALLRQIIAETK